jgi:uncharacterized MAPEG superfamily protein
MMSPLPTEIVMLGLGAALLLVQMFLQSISSAMETGAGYKAGPRDEARVLQSVFAGRADRAFRNLLETFPVFAALALALVVTGRTGGLGALGAEVWIIARILFVPLYLIRIPLARSLVWFVSIFAVVAMLVRLFQ